MPEPIAFLNGQWIAASQLSIPVTDAGFVQGVTVAEQMRTFGGRLFRLEHHLHRLAHSLDIVGIQPGYSLNELGGLAEELAGRNHALLPAGSDLGLCLFVTPGPYRTFQPEGGPPLVAMHTYELPFRLWADLYQHGQAVVTTPVTQVPSSCWPPELKCRSRMHYHLADRQAALKVAGARALLLDLHGFVSEASTANLVIYRRLEGIVTPPEDRVLPGVSVAVLQQLAGKLDIPVSQRPLRLDDVIAADEVLLTSTSPCIVPVTHCDQHPIGTGLPGDVFNSLIRAWSELVGVDILKQAQQFSH